MPKFSRTTVVELVSALAFSTHSEISKFGLTFELDEVSSSGGIEPRTVAIMRYLIDNPERKGPSGANLIVEIIEYLVETRLRKRSWQHDYEPEDVFPKLVHALKQDGYAIEDGKLKSMLPEALPILEQRSELDQLLEHYQFSMAQGHLQEAMSAHTRGDWAAANSQLRTFIESMFDTIVEKLVSDKKQLPQTSQGKRELLFQLNPPFFRADLNEWDATGKCGFVQGFWKRLHPQGPHPGLSDEEDSTFRLHVVLIVARHYMRRLHNRMGGISA